MSEPSPERSKAEGEWEPRTNQIPPARFDMGDIVVTHEAHFSLEVRGRHPFQLLARHVEGDWGNVSKHQAMENEQSADLGSGRILSTYDIEDGRFYVTTEPDRSSTTIFLPDDY